jgi:hypothetical protein
MRTATAADLEMLRAWIAADEDHRETTLPEFFVKAPAGVSCGIVSDPIGPVFAIRFERCLRLHIQFMPQATASDRGRVADALLEGLGWLKNFARGQSFQQLIFVSAVQPLVRFCERRLGFRQSHYELTLDLTPPPVTNDALHVAEAVAH